MRRLLWVILILLFSACATQREQVSAARVLSLHTKAVQAELQQFSDLRTIADRLRQRSINAIDDARVERENQNDEILRTLALSDSQRLDLFRGIIAASNAAAARAADAAVQRRANEAALAATTSKVAMRNTELGKTAKLLTSLSERDKLSDELKFYRAFWADVNKSIDDANKAAEGDATAAPKEEKKP